MISSSGSGTMISSRTKYGFEICLFTFFNDVRADILGREVASKTIKIRERMKKPLDKLLELLSFSSKLSTFRNY